ncbi:MAG TPA: type II toxin-antitoxin system VapC family toxin [Acidimicrobiales bacterium]|nr:type II toxin-antitoxin system VapC family toxin [Acidimicrobiales bacterium]
MRRFLYDTAVFVYALGTGHRYRAPCRRLVRLAGDGLLVGDASVELVQELAHVRSRRGGDRRQAMADAHAAADLCRLHAVEVADVRLALSLVAADDRLDVRDGIHAATALNRGIDTIVSPDRAFDAVVGLERIDPADAESVLLAGS